MADPKMTIAAGCFGADGYGRDFPENYPYHLLEGITLKTATVQPMDGNPEPTVWHGPSFSLNAVGLANPGLNHVLEQVLPWWQNRGCRIGVSIRGSAPNEWRLMAVRAEIAGADYLELNLSCPNLPGYDASPRSLFYGLADVMDSVTLPVHAKVAGDERFALDLLNHAEPDRLVIGNTMAVGSVHALLGGGVEVCGMSGPPLLPVHIAALRAVRRSYASVHLAACGGIGSAEDVSAYQRAGADSFQMGTAVLHDPFRPVSWNA